MSAVAAFFRDIKLGQARAVLFGTWLFGALAVFLSVAFASLQQFSAGGAATAWEWLLPAIGPTLALVTASAVVNALEREPAEDCKLQRPIVFAATLAWSLVYLAALIAMIAAATQWDSAPTSAATPLAVMQIILAALLGAFFAAKTT
jgi:hypothetical protein